MDKSSQREFYATEAAGYEATRYGSRYGRLFRSLHRAAVTRALQVEAKTDSALDVATGTGQMLPVLAAKCDRVVVSDITPKMLLVARKKYSNIPGIQYCVASADSLPFESETFDVVTSSRFLHLFELAKQRLLLEEMSRVLRPGGVLIVDFYSADARRLFSLPIAIYRILLRKRPENDFRTTMLIAREMVESAGLQIIETFGVGNFLMLPLLWLPCRWKMRIGTWLGKHFSRASEQFLVVARK